MTEFAELPETHIERMDRLQMEHDHRKELEQLKADRDVKVAREKRKAERSDMWKSIGIAFVIGLVVLGVVAGTIYGTTRPESPGSYKTSEAYREDQCVANHGVWVNKDLLADTVDGHSLCLYPGRPAAEQVPPSN